MDIIAKTTENKDVILDLCGTSCGGVEGAHGECCNVKGKDWVIGPIEDTEKVLKKFSDLTYDDIFMNFEEGSKRFPDSEGHQDPTAYPAMRIAQNGRCIFYKNKKCSIYDKRPSLCFSFYCAYLKNSVPFEVHHPHRAPGVPIYEGVFKGVKEDLVSEW